MGPKVTLSKDGKKATIEVDLDAEPKSTPKMFLYGNTSGFQDAGATINGRPVRCNVMLGVRKTDEELAATAK